MVANLEFTIFQARRRGLEDVSTIRPMVTDEGSHSRRTTSRAAAEGPLPQHDDTMLATESIHEVATEVILTAQATSVETGRDMNILYVTRGGARSLPFLFIP